MSEGKKLNQEKFRKNVKYKNYSKPVAKDTKVKNLGNSVTNIDSNWDRYNEIENEEADCTITRDYKTISEAPQGTYFQMKKDKQFLSDTDSKFECGELFKMNLDQICLGIMSIPFYERFGIEKDLLNENLISSMDASAEENLKIYEDYLIEKSKPKAVQLSEPVVVASLKPIVDEKKDATAVIKTQNVADLESWLDGILD